MEYIRQGKVCWHARGAGKVRVLWAQGSSVGICFFLALFLYFSPYMALKVFEGGFCQPSQGGS